MWSSVVPMQVWWLPLLVEPTSLDPFESTTERLPQSGPRCRWSLPIDDDSFPNYTCRESVCHRLRQRTDTNPTHHGPTGMGSFVPCVYTSPSVCVDPPGPVDQRVVRVGTGRCGTRPIVVRVYRIPRRVGLDSASGPIEPRPPIAHGSRGWSWEQPRSRWTWTGSWLRAELADDPVAVRSKAREESRLWVAWSRSWYATRCSWSRLQLWSQVAWLRARHRCRWIRPSRAGVQRFGATAEVGQGSEFSAGVFRNRIGIGVAPLYRTT